MKKIIFVTSALEIGGIESALIEILKVLPKDKLDIKVLAFYRKGELYDVVKELSTSLSIVPCPIPTVRSVFDDIKKGRILSAIHSGLKKCMYKVFANTRGKKSVWVTKKLPKETECYDIAVAFHDPYVAQVMHTIENITARKKVAWIHRDVSGETEFNYDADKEFIDIYRKFDEIIAVSENTKKSFVTRHPELENKSRVIYNLIDAKRITALADESVELNRLTGEYTICTVGRLHPDKGYHMAVEACAILVDLGYNIKWYICGDGDDKNELEDYILANKMQEHFILLGNQINPYKYVNFADIYVQTSVRESYCIALAEARTLKKPIVSTSFSCVSEQIKSGYNGLVVDMNPAAIAEGIKKLLDSQTLREELIKNLSADNDEDKRKILKLFLED